MGNFTLLNSQQTQENKCIIRFGLDPWEYWECRGAFGKTSCRLEGVSEMRCLSGEPIVYQMEVVIILLNTEIISRPVEGDRRVYKERV